jgi:hypothetical protein
MAASQKSGKKRVAPTQNGPKVKKAHLESTKFDQRRSQPITQPITTSQESDGSDRSDEEDIGNDEYEFADDFEAVEEDESAMPVDSKPQQHPKDPNGMYRTLFPKNM